MMCMAGGEKPPSLYDGKEENRPPKVNEKPPNPVGTEEENRLVEIDEKP